jgi:hypothetical protein
MCLIHPSTIQHSFTREYSSSDSTSTIGGATWASLSNWPSFAHAAPTQEPTPMVLRQLLVATLVALTLQASTAATSIVPSCPRSLETMLASEPCSGRMERLLASRMIVEPNSVQDVCLDSLRALVATSPSIPCVANVNPPTVSGHSHMRRLLSDLKGKHNCTVDMVAPLNQPNLTQNFMIDCKEITDPDDRDWIWLLVALSVLVLVACGLSGVMKMKDWRAKRAPTCDRPDR